MQSFDYSSLPLILKLSNWMSWKEVKVNLKAGNWLDIMSGYRAILQLSQIENRKISEFFAIDQRLNQNLLRGKIHTKQYRINKRILFGDRRFDNITLINGLEHLVWPQDILNECYRILKPRGILQVIIPTPFAKPILEFLAFKIKIQPQITESISDHKMYYDEKILKPMMVKAGFKPITIKFKRIKFYCSLYAYAKKES